MTEPSAEAVVRFQEVVTGANLSRQVAVSVVDVALSRKHFQASPKVLEGIVRGEWFSEAHPGALKQQPTTYEAFKNAVIAGDTDLFHAYLVLFETAYRAFWGSLDSVVRAWSRIRNWIAAGRLGGSTGKLKLEWAQVFVVWDAFLPALEKQHRDPPAAAPRAARPRSPDRPVHVVRQQHHRRRARSRAPAIPPPGPTRATASHLPTTVKHPDTAFRTPPGGATNQVNRGFDCMMFDCVGSSPPPAFERGVCIRQALGVDGCTASFYRRAHKFPQAFTAEHLRQRPHLLTTPLDSSVEIAPQDYL